MAAPTSMRCNEMLVKDPMTRKETGGSSPPALTQAQEALTTREVTLEDDGAVPPSQPLMDRSNKRRVTLTTSALSASSVPPPVHLVDPTRRGRFRFRKKRLLLNQTSTTHDNYETTRCLDALSFECSSKRDTVKAVESGQFDGVVARPSERTTTQWTRHDFTAIEKIGKGKFGVVKQARVKKCGTKVALKQLARVDNDKWKKELNIQRRLDHKHILKALGYFQEKKCVTLVLELAEYGSLQDYRLEPDDGCLSVSDAKMFMRQAASAVAYLASHHVAHRDIKPENLVLTSRDTLKLIDFGHAVKSAPRDFRNSLCGTPEYVPPEMLSRNCRYLACHVDPWALGVLAFELVQGYSPFYVCEQERPRDVLIFDQIRAFSVLDRPTQVDCELENFYDFLSALLKPVPDQRMSASSALEHSWLTTTISS